MENYQSHSGPEFPIQRPVYKKVDTDNLALIGHSRGGEAVGHAALLNQLPFYSDDASIKFDYNFNIKSIIEIRKICKKTV